jgi:tetratricopeptide (TPR) repeat protein
VIVTNDCHTLVKECAYAGLQILYARDTVTAPIAGSIVGSLTGKSRMRTAFRGWVMFVFVATALACAGCGGADARKQSYLERGDQYFAQQNYEKARVEYRNAAQIDPTDPQARYALGRTSEKMGNARDAVAQYQAAVDQNGQFVPARAALARLFLFGGLPDKALELVEKGLADAPNSSELLTVRAAVRTQKGNIEGAFEDANAAFAANSADEYTIAMLASLYRQSARTDKAIEIVRAGIEKLPSNVDLRVVLAELELGQKHASEAEEQLKKVIELEPKVPTHRYRLARFYILQKNLDGAESTLRAGVKFDPEDATAKLALVEFLSAQRGTESAEKQLQTFISENPRDQKLKLQLGAYYEQREQYAKAEQSYRAVIADSGTKPDGLMARNRLAAMFLKRNDGAGAARLVDEVLKENPRDNDALVMRGNLALARGDTTSAIVDLRSVLRDQPNAVLVMRALARAHLQNREFTLAEETFRNAIQVNPRDPDGRLDLAQFLAQTGKSDQAKTLLEQLSTELPNNVPVQESLFRLYAAQKDFAAARQRAQKIQELHPDLALGYFLGGIVDEADGKIQDAIKAYELALKAQPMAGEPLAALVRLELARKQPDSALARVDRALAADAKNIFANNLRGELLFARGKFADARLAYAATIDVAPQWWIPYRGMAATHSAEKDFDAAATVLRRGIEASHGAPALHSELASLYERLGKPAEAIASYEEWLRRDPRSIVAANNLAMLLVSQAQDQKNLSRAQQLATQLSGSDEPAVLDTRGWVDYKSGNFRQAVELLARANEKSSTSPVLKYHLGMAQLASGDAQSARKSLEAALSGGADFRGADEAQATLVKLKQTEKA